MPLEMQYIEIEIALHLSFSARVKSGYNKLFCPYSKNMLYEAILRNFSSATFSVYLYIYLK